MITCRYCGRTDHASYPVPVIDEQAAVAHRLAALQGEKPPRTRLWAYYGPFCGRCHVKVPLAELKAHPDWRLAE